MRSKWWNCFKSLYMNVLVYFSPRVETWVVCPMVGEWRQRRCNSKKILLLEEEEENEEVAKQENMMTKMLWNDLGKDVIAEILVHLPVEAVFRCKSVCKQWWASINSSLFIGQYRRRWKKSSPCGLFMHFACQTPPENETFLHKAKSNAVSSISHRIHGWKRTLRFLLLQPKRKILPWFYAFFSNQ